MIGPAMAEMCRTVDEAAGFLASTNVIGKACANIGLLDARGKGMVVEKGTLREQYIWESADAPLFATTNFRSRKMCDLTDPRPDTHVGESRYQSIALLVDKVSHDIEGMRTILTSHGDGDGGPVCCHFGQEGGQDTVFSAVLIPRERRILRADGPPCEHEYVELTLD
jgi:hypothetical protein